MTSPETFLVFAYGSNMFTRRIHERCPSAIALGMAELRGHAIRWHKRSVDGSGKCDVEPSDDKASTVYGVLYKIPEQDKAALDRAEGLGKGYAEKSVEVLCDGTPRIAALYQATNSDALFKPYSSYKALVVAGAKEHGLPAEYIRMLEATEATEDPDRARDERSRRILTGAHPA